MQLEQNIINVFDGFTSQWGISCGMMMFIFLVILLESGEYKLRSKAFNPYVEENPHSPN